MKKKDDKKMGKLRQNILVAIVVIIMFAVSAAAGFSGISFSDLGAQFFMSFFISSDEDENTVELYSEEPEASDDASAEASDENTEDETAEDDQPTETTKESE